MRLFIAILFDEDTVDEIAALRDALHDEAVKGSFTTRENLHLTLEFLGEVEPSRINAITDILDEIRTKAFTLSMSSTSFFSRPDGAICYLKVEEKKELMNLQHFLHQRLQEEGFEVEKRKYRPHITLARRVKGRVVEKSLAKPIIIEAAGVDLMLSERADRGMIYTSLYHKGL